MNFDLLTTKCEKEGGSIEKRKGEKEKHNGREEETQWERRRNTMGEKKKWKESYKSKTRKGRKEAFAMIH